MDLLTDEHSVALEKTKWYTYKMMLSLPPKAIKPDFKLNFFILSSSMVCGYMIEGVMYKCKSCFNYDLCERCHDEKAPPPLTNLSHKPSHKFKKLEMTWRWPPLDANCELPTMCLLLLKKHKQIIIFCSITIPSRQNAFFITVLADSTGYVQGIQGNPSWWCNHTYTWSLNSTTEH